jgi:plastocyanin
MQPKRILLLGALVALVALLAAGCGGSSDNSSGQSEPASTSGNAESGGGSGSGKRVTIKETEYKLTPSSVTLDETGTYTFKVVNTGSTTHALEIEGNGVEEESGDISPGDTKTFTVDLKTSGTYEMYCPVDGHRQQGMEGKLTIGNAGAGSAGTTNDTSTTETETHTDTTGGGGGGGGGY